MYNGSSFTNLDDPVGVNGTYITGISGGTIVGSYLDSGGIANGFVYNGSSFTTVDVSGVVNGTYISGISGSTEVGYYRNTLTRPAITVGFLYNGSSFTYPSNLTGVGLLPTGVNGSTVVGDYTSGLFNPPTYGFVSNGSSFTTLDEPASLKSTYITGISGSTIVGYYPDASGLDDGFVYNGATTVAFGAAAGTIVSVSTTQIVTTSPAGGPRAGGRDRVDDGRNIGDIAGRQFHLHTCSDLHQPKQHNLHRGHGRLVFGDGQRIPDSDIHRIRPSAERRDIHLSRWA